MNDWLYSALDYLADVPRSGAGEGVEVRWEHTWPWASWVALLIAACSVAIVCRAYHRESLEPKRRRIGLAALRLLALSIVLFMLFGWTRNAFRTDLADLAIVFDVSASMDIDDESGSSDSSRLDLVKKLLLDGDGAILAELSRKYNLRLYSVGHMTHAMCESDDQSGRPAHDAAVQAISRLRAEEPQSRLGQGLLEVLELQRGRPTAAVVLFTDGVTTEGKPLSEASDSARRRQIPLHIIAMGRQSQAADLRVVDLVVDEAAFVNDQLQFDVKLAASGMAGKQITVRLVREDSEELLDQQQLIAGNSKELLALRLSHRPPQAGEFRYRVEAVPIDDEVTTENNRLSRQVRVSEVSLNVLYVQGYPDYEFRTLKTYLARQRLSMTGGERAVRLRTVLQEADPEYLRSDETAELAFPTNRAALLEYDVVLFGDCDPSLFSAATLSNLVEFVREGGGGLVIMSGVRHTPAAFRNTPLADLLPMRFDSLSVPPMHQDILDPFVPLPSSLGQATPWLQMTDTPQENFAIWTSLPGIYWSIDAPDLKPGAMVLLEHPTKTAGRGMRIPLICSQHVGAGTVITHLTNDLWRWSRDERGPEFYERYWEQLLRYLARARLLGRDGVRISTDRNDTYIQGEPVGIRVQFMNERQAPPNEQEVMVVLEHEAGTRRQTQMTRDLAGRAAFSAQVTGLLAGDYRVWLATPAITDEPVATTFRVTAPRGELYRLEADIDDLRVAADRTRGQVVVFQESSRLLALLPAGQQVRIESLPPRSFWNRWPLPLAFLLCLTVEWVLRKRWGLL